ncbi:MAG: hypothetical protein VKK59_07215 [Vampirovibrionales bacterium]|nr:hypothetical protein [Vampirovibrionales bacterium]
MAVNPALPGISERTKEFKQEPSKKTVTVKQGDWVSKYALAAMESKGVNFTQEAHKYKLNAKQQEAYMNQASAALKQNNPNLRDINLIRPGQTLDISALTTKTQQQWQTDIQTFAQAQQKAQAKKTEAPKQTPEAKKTPPQASPKPDAGTTTPSTTPPPQENPKPEANNNNFGANIVNGFTRGATLGFAGETKGMEGVFGDLAGSGFFSVAALGALSKGLNRFGKAGKIAQGGVAIGAGLMAGVRDYNETQNLGSAFWNGATTAGAVFAGSHLMKKGWGFGPTLAVTTFSDGVLSGAGRVGSNVFTDRPLWEGVGKTVALSSVFSVFGTLASRPKTGHPPVASTETTPPPATDAGVVDATTTPPETGDTAGTRDGDSTTAPPPATGDTAAAGTDNATTTPPAKGAGTSDSTTTPPPKTGPENSGGEKSSTSGATALTTESITKALNRGKFKDLVRALPADQKPIGLNITDASEEILNRGTQRVPTTFEAVTGGASYEMFTLPNGTMAVFPTPQTLGSYQTSAPEKGIFTFVPPSNNNASGVTMLEPAIVIKDANGNNFTVTKKGKIATPGVKSPGSS